MRKSEDTLLIHSFGVLEKRYLREFLRRTLGFGEP